jgi:predicted transcriptional regulator
MNKFINTFFIIFYMAVENKITLVRIRRKKMMTINDELMWFGRSLGLFSSRDKNKSCYRIFVEILKNPDGLSSDELAFKLKITRATVIHHLKRLLASGIVIKQGNKYLLRVSSLTDLVDNLKEDILINLKELKKSAEKIDKLL